MAAGPIIARAAICETYRGESIELHAPQLCRPVCMLWPAFVDLVPAWTPPLPSWAGEGVCDKRRILARSRGGVGADRLVTRSLRRAAARAILEAAAGQWYSCASHLYLDLEFGN